jgi:hypothetical protein
MKKHGRFVSAEAFPMGSGNSGKKTGALVSNQPPMRDFSRAASDMNVLLSLRSATVYFSRRKIASKF